QTSAPYYAGETPQVIHTSYDVLDRVTASTNPDGSSVTKTYGLSTAITSDELGHPVQDFLDAQSHTIRHREWLDGGVNATVYSYAVSGHVGQTVDAVGNSTTFAFDSLGRKLQMTDPDAGTWSYAYDAAGRMTSQTDPKGQVISFGYDALGRRI